MGPNMMRFSIKTNMPLRAYISSYTLIVVDMLIKDIILVISEY